MTRADPLPQLPPFSVLAAYAWLRGVRDGFVLAIIYLVIDAVVREFVK